MVQKYLFTKVKYPQKVATKLDWWWKWANFAFYRKIHIYFGVNPLPITYSQHPHFHKQWNFQFQMQEIILISKRNQTRNPELNNQIILKWCGPTYIFWHFYTDFIKYVNQDKWVKTRTCKDTEDSIFLQSFRWAQISCGLGLMPCLRRREVIAVSRLFNQKGWKADNLSRQSCDCGIKEQSAFTQSAIQKGNTHTSIYFALFASTQAR